MQLTQNDSDSADESCLWNIQLVCYESLVAKLGLRLFYQFTKLKQSNN